LASNSFADGVGHPEEALADVGGADAVCAQYRRPAGVTFSFQVCENSIDPSEANRSRNLFAKDCVRATLADEPKPLRPQMPCVSTAALSAGITEGLAGTGAGPNRSSCRPSGEGEGVVPSGNTGEEMAAAIPGNVICIEVADIAVIHVPFCNVPGGDQVAQPLRAVGVGVVVERAGAHHAATGALYCGCAIV
jgi:hypothetical protein